MSGNGVQITIHEVGFKKKTPNHIKNELIFGSNIVLNCCQHITEMGGSSFMAVPEIQSLRVAVAPFHNVRAWFSNICKQAYCAAEKCNLNFTQLEQGLV